jgi:hypothetical protein
MGKKNQPGAEVREDACPSPARICNWWWFYRVRGEVHAAQPGVWESVVSPGQREEGMLYQNPQCGKKRAPLTGASLKTRCATSKHAGDARSLVPEAVVGEVCSRGGGDPVLP